jgi:hypothetical protein
VANLVGLLRVFLAPICQSFCSEYCGGVPAAKEAVKA